MFRNLLIYLPLSVIGLWRWSYWLVRKVGAALYRPPRTTWPKRRKMPTVSVVTPVYNESDELFEQAMSSWIANGVDEIVAVVDATNTHLIADFERKYAHLKGVSCRLFVTPKRGKRAALCDGIMYAKGEIIALVDSDTVWGEGVRLKSLAAFLDPRVGGVTVPQRIMNPNSASNVIFDLMLWNRYTEEVPFLLALGGPFNTLSGRTAFYRREALINEHDNVHQLRHEFFFKTRGVSGDDKRLTHLILEQGWRLGLASDVVVYTQGLGSFRQFLKQRLRWIRNSWRADLRAARRGWIFRYPALAYFVLDRFIQPFFMIFGPIACLVAAYQREWILVGVLITWWLLSRTVRIFSYLRHYPKRIRYIPIYILYGYINALMKIYALGTLLEHSWATRWDLSRIRRRLMRRASTVAIGSLVVMAALIGVAQLISQLNQASAANVSTPYPVTDGEFAPAGTAPAATAVVPPGALLPTQVVSYTVSRGDSLSLIAARYGMDLATIKKLNNLHTYHINPGQILLVYDTQRAR